MTPEPVTRHSAVGQRGAGFVLIAVLALVLTHAGVPTDAQVAAPPQQPAQANAGRGSRPLPDGPFEFDTSEQGKIRTVVVTRGLVQPWALAFLPDGGMLVTERGGTVRLVRQGKLDPKPVATLSVGAAGLSGLMDIALHPNFAQNQWVYLTYNKPGPANARWVTLARGTWNGSEIVDVKELFVTDCGIGAARLTFGRDGLLYWVVGGPPGPADAMKSQDPNQHTGKTLRLKDDGTPADGNPFIGMPGHKPEVYSIGHRNQEGLTVNPVTGEIWETEQGPQGGDEVNIIRAGKNYGWPLVSYGRWYEGPRVTDVPYREGMEMPVVYWVPSIATTGMTFYTGDRFPRWKNNLFVGSMIEARTAGTGHLERIVFNDKWEEMRRESLLVELKQRIRDVRQGPDGLLYVLTAEGAGALLRLEPIGGPVS